MMDVDFPAAMNLGCTAMSLSFPAMGAVAQGNRCAVRWRGACCRDCAQRRRSLCASPMPHAPINMRQVNLADIFRLVISPPSVETALSRNRRLDCSTDQVRAIVLVSSLSVF